MATDQDAERLLEKAVAAAAELDAADRSRLTAQLRAVLEELPAAPGRFDKGLRARFEAAIDELEHTD